MRRSEKISWEEIRLHKSEENCWMVMHGKVYDLAGYLEDHPGGVNKIMEWAGQDGGSAFDGQRHSKDAMDIAEKFCIGEVETGGNKLWIAVVLLLVLGGAAVYLGLI